EHTWHLYPSSQREEFGTTISTLPKSAFGTITSTLPNIQLGTIISTLIRAHLAPYIHPSKE
ncbi:hypothetical protein SK128_023009, partial [Halocaridina rubra]